MRATRTKLSDEKFRNTTIDEFFAMLDKKK
jgi:hypothetical protein